MRRRDVLAGGLVWGQLLAARRVLAQPAASTRGAVVIGVNKTGNLPVLRAAVSGARSIAQWLTTEGFEVKLITDEVTPVTGVALRAAVTEFVNRGTLTQLVIYFSGHGIAFGNNEFWLLSGAPDDVNEAVSLTECVALAGRSAVSNVVIICDACRSNSDFDSSLLHGTVIFPLGSYIPGRPSPEVDRFFSTRPGAPSYELRQKAADEFQGVFTETFLDAFRKPRPDMVSTVGGVSVVSNRKLKTFLLDEVPQRLRVHNASLAQYPDARIESPDSAYLGRVRGSVTAAVDQPRDVTLVDVAAHQFNRTAVGALASLRNIDSVRELEVASNTGFNAAQQSLIVAKQPATTFNAPTGFSVTGVRLREAWLAGGRQAEIVSPGNGTDQSGLVNIPVQDGSPMTAALVFADGSGTVLAALPGFIGSLTVRNGGVADVTYAPSPSSRRWGEYKEAGPRLDQLRALMATSAQFGVLRIEGDRQTRSAAASRLADQIRVLKGIDPTLGIYAAYAYADANLPQQVASVRSFMAGDLEGELFDLALLADVLSDSRISERVVPFCPMFSQGWQLIRTRKVVLRDQVLRARDSLRSSLWTTFGPPGMKLMLEALATASR
jgi:hypothetical protein